MVADGDEGTVGAVAAGAGVPVAVGGLRSERAAESPVTLGIAVGAVPAGNAALFPFSP